MQAACHAGIPMKKIEAVMKISGGIIMKKVIMIVGAVVLGLVVVFSVSSKKNDSESLSRILEAMQNEKSEPAKETNTALTSYTLQELVSPCAELVTADYTYSNAATITDFHDLGGIKIPFTTEEIVFTYSGTIKTGINLQDTAFDVNNDSKTIYITLPKAHVISHEIDLNSYQFETVKDSWFNAIEADEFTKEAAANKGTMLVRAEESGELYEKAESNAEEALRNLLDRSGLTHGFRYQFIFAK